MGPEDVYALTSVGDPRISPDGQRVAYVVMRIDEEANAYRTAIWVAPLDGSEEPRQFTSGERNDGSPRWSPDGRWLAFVSNRDGDEKKAKGQLYVLPADGGEPRKLTDGKESVESVAWSPDSSRIAFARRVPDEAYEEEDDRKRAPRRFTRVFFKLDSVGWTADRRKHVFVVGLDGDEERQLTDGDCEDDTPAWAPDGKRIVFGSLRGDTWDTDFNEALYELEVDAEGAEPKRLTGTDESAGSASFSPDGALIAYIHSPEDGTFPHHGQIAVMRADGSDRRVLTASLDRQCAPFPGAREPVWDGDRVAFGVEDGGNVHVYRFRPTVRASRSCSSGASSRPALYDLANGVLVYSASTHDRPPELFAGAGKQITSVADDFVGGRELAEVERFTATSADGTEVDAWLVRPPGFDEKRGYPTLLTVHGGPFSQYGHRLLRRGPGVCRRRLLRPLLEPARRLRLLGGVGPRDPRPPGRRRGAGLGLGRLRGPDGRRGHGAGEVPVPRPGTARSAGRFVRRLHDVLDRRAHEALQGGALGAIGQQPRERLRLERPVLDLRAPVRQLDVGQRRRVAGDVTGHLCAGHRHAVARRPLRERPPLQHRAGRASVLLLPRLLGKETEMLRFPAESHELSRSGSPVHRVLRFEAILEWFGRYLEPGRN